MKTGIPFLIFLLLIGYLSQYEQNIVFSKNLDRIDLHDPDSIHQHKPVLIAHRGGVVTKEAPECSFRALRQAADQGYVMVELDIQESRDHIPVLFHDGTMSEACGMDKKIADFTAEELSHINLLKMDSEEKSDQTILTLEQAFTACEELNLGVMLDIKDDGSESFYLSLADGLEKHSLTRSTVCIATFPNVGKYLQGKTIFRISDEDVMKVNYQKPVDVKGKMWFGWPRHITNDMVKEFEKRGAIVVPSINIFHYPSEIHFERAYSDIQRMKEAGVEMFQIDSIYDKYL